MTRGGRAGAHRQPGDGSPARELEVPAAEVAAAEVPAPEVAAAEVAAAGIAVTVPAADEGVGCERLPEQEPGEQAGAEAEAAPVTGREAGVDVVDLAAVGLDLAHLGLDAPL